MAHGADLFDIIRTTRAMRRLRPDPVPDALIRTILEAGVSAANGGNAQRWRFLVIKDPAVKRAVQAIYKRAFTEVVGPRYASSSPPPGMSAERFRPPAPGGRILDRAFSRSAGVDRRLP